nr:hypothetical protein [Tanacetum cinerariifolium]
MDTPMVEKSKLVEDKEGKAIDSSHYRGMIGTLLYLTARRPDLQFDICMCAWILLITLTAAADLDHVGCQDTRRSTSGSMQFLGDRLNWRDLPIALDSVEVLRYDKRSKSEIKGKVPTEMELVLEQTQQGTSHEVSVNTYVIRNTKPLSGIEDSRHGPSDAMHNASLTTQGPSTDCCFISHGDYTHFYRLCHSELVDIEKVARSSASDH